MIGTLAHLSFFSFFFFFFDKYPGVGSLDHMMVLFSVVVFWRSSILFSKWLHQFTFPPTVYKGSLFSTPFPTFLFKRLVLSSIANPSSHSVSFYSGVFGKSTPRFASSVLGARLPRVCGFRIRAALSALLAHFASCVTCSTQPSLPLPLLGTFLKSLSIISGKKGPFLVE